MVVVVVVVVVDEAADDFDWVFAAVVLVEPAAAAVVLVAVVLEVVVHGTVVGLPTAWATPLTFVPPPVAPRYGATRAPHDVATRDNTTIPSSPADLLFTVAPRTQAYLDNTGMAAALRLPTRPFRPLFETTYTHRTRGHPDTGVRFRCPAADSRPIVLVSPRQRGDCPSIDEPNGVHLLVLFGGQGGFRKWIRRGVAA